MPPSRPSQRQMLLSAYAMELGVPLTELLVRLHLCPVNEASAHIEAGAFRLDGRVLDDPTRLIQTKDLRAGSVAELHDQQVILGFWFDEEPPGPPKPPRWGLLLVRSIERWDEYNEYEGACRAIWNGSEYCFRLVLVGDEWDRVRVGATWEADVHFNCDSPVEVLDDSPTLVPELRSLAGVNHILCGRILRLVDDEVQVAAPRPLCVALDHCRCLGGSIEPGRWLRARGILEARMPD